MGGDGPHASPAAALPPEGAAAGLGRPGAGSGDAAIFGTLKTPFDEAIAFFRQKLNLPSERWDDIWQAAHDRAFIVACAQKADLLGDLRAAPGARK